MGKRKTCLLVMLIFALVFSLSGCKKVYTKKDMIEYAEQTLEDKYGEEFQVRGDVFNVRDTAFQVNVSPVNNPEIVFEAGYNVAGSEASHDFYIEALVASQYKELAEKELGEIPCDYCLRVEVPWDKRENPITDTSITIDEFNKITEEKYQNVKFTIYFSKEILEETDDYIYGKLLSIIEIHESRLKVFFLTKEDLELVKSDYSERYRLEGSTMDIIYDGYTGKLIGGKKGYIYFLGGEQKEKLSIEEFTKKMEEIREDAKQW